MEASWNSRYCWRYATYETSASGNFNALNLQSQTIRFHTASSQDFNLASEKMRLTSAGKPGMEPLILMFLHISSSDAAPLKVERDGVNCSVHTKNNVDDVYFGVNSYRNAAIGHDLNQNLAPFQITTGGNVGIGTNNPDGPLHIEYNSSTARASVNNNNTVGLKVENTNSAGVAQIHLRAGDGDAHILVEDVGSNASDMFFSVDGTEPAMTIKNAGDVGIGTTAPSGKSSCSEWSVI